MGGTCANLFWTEILDALFAGYRACKRRCPTESRRRSGCANRCRGYGGGLWRKRLLLELEKPAG